MERQLTAPQPPEVSTLEVPDEPQSALSASTVIGTVIIVGAAAFGIYYLMDFRKISVWSNIKSMFNNWRNGETKQPEKLYIVEKGTDKIDKPVLHDTLDMVTNPDMKAYYLGLSDEEKAKLVEVKTLD